MNKKGIVVAVVVVIAILGICGVIKTKDNTSTTNNISGVVEKKNDLSKKEIEILNSGEFESGAAWISGKKDGEYYMFAIDSSGEAVFAIENFNESYNRVLDVKNFVNGYSIILIDTADSRYYVIVDKDGNLIYTGNSDDEFITDIDNSGFCLEKVGGKIRAINAFEGGKAYPFFSFKGLESVDDYKSLGCGIYYNKYYGFISAVTGNRVVSNEIEGMYTEDEDGIYFDDTGFKHSKFVDNKALIYASTGAKVYALYTDGTAKLINFSGGTIDFDSFNGESFYAEDSSEEKRGFYNLDGELILNLYKYDVDEVSKIQNNKVLVKFREPSRDEKYVLLDIDGKEIFEPIELPKTSVDIKETIIDADLVLENECVFDFNGNILNFGEDFDCIAADFKSGVFTIRKFIDVSNDEWKFVDRNMKEIVPCYTDNLKIVNPYK